MCNLGRRPREETTKNAPLPGVAELLAYPSPELDLRDCRLGAVCWRGFHNRSKRAPLETKDRLKSPRLVRKVYPSVRADAKRYND